MKKEKKEAGRRISMQEIIAAVLSQNDVAGAYLILPGQQAIHITKEGTMYEKKTVLS